MVLFLPYQDTHNGKLPNRVCVCVWGVGIIRGDLFVIALQKSGGILRGAEK